MIVIDNIFNKDNHVYRITRELNLDGKTLTIPNNCVLDFTGGGYITNGALEFNNTAIWPNGCMISDYFKEVTITGTYKTGQCVFEPSVGPKWWSGSGWLQYTSTQA